MRLRQVGLHDDLGLARIGDIDGGEVLRGAFVRKPQDTTAIGRDLEITVVALPVYWVLEPDRQAGAEKAQEELFVEWGALLFAPTGDNISAFNCAGCHGGMKATGGVAEYNITDPATGEVRSVSWYAPALNTIFYRYSEEEVRYILVYGRPFSPMPAWGVEGGGPMNAQQIDTLLAYLKSIQIE